MLQAARRLKGDAVRRTGCYLELIVVRFQQLDGILGERSDSSGLVRIGWIILKQVCIVFEHGAAAAGAGEDGVGSLLDVRPPSVDVAPRMRSRFVGRAQMLRYGAAAAGRGCSSYFVAERAEQLRHARIQTGLQGRLNAAFQYQYAACAWHWRGPFGATKLARQLGRKISWQ